MSSFGKVVREVQLWLSRAGAGRFGRTDCLRPDVQPSRLIWDRVIDDVEPLIPECRAAVRQVIDARRRMINSLLSPDPGVVDGRLAAFLPGRTHGDGLSEDASQGLVDDYDQVGWDYWVGVSGDDRYTFQIICWIPAEHEKAFSAAIETNVVASLVWLP